MKITTLAEGNSVSVLDYRCTATPDTPAQAEAFACVSLSFVRAGSFGCRLHGKHHELLPGSLLIGRTGDEYTCTHDHHCGGDACVSVQLAPACADELGHRVPWHSACLPPLPELLLPGALLGAAVDRRTDVAIDEAALLLTDRFLALADAHRKRSDTSRAASHQRRRLVEAALWIDANADDALTLDRMAAQAHLSPFHFLRAFARSFRVTPHQYLLTARMRRAVHLLATTGMPVSEVALAAGFPDLSNFHRSFRRATGLTPASLRTTRGKLSKILHALPASLVDNHGHLSQQGARHGKYPS